MFAGKGFTDSVQAILSALDAFLFKGVISCAGSPNYPAANAGYIYIVSTAGKIGGASGSDVEVNDVLICKVDGTAAGTQAAVGDNWTILQVNLNLSIPPAIGDITPNTGGFTTIKFKTDPTIGPFVEGKVYYDALWKTLSANISSDITLQIGQEDLRMVYNNTVGTILNGEAVYTSGVYNGGTNDVATVALANASAVSTALVLGCATQDILPSTYGFVTVRGYINNFNTNKIGAARVITQKLLFKYKVAGTAANAATIVVVDTTSGGLSYTEVENGAITIDLGGTTPTIAQVVTKMMTTTPSAYVDVSIYSAGGTGNLTVASAVSLFGGVDTTAGDLLYLSDYISGHLVTVVPENPSYQYRVGRLITKSNTVGRINVRLIQDNSLNGLSDTTIISPVNNDVLTWNGSSWINGSGVVVSGSAGISFYRATPEITASGNDNLTQILTLSKTPVVTAEVVKTTTVGNATVAMSAWLYDTALGRTSIDAGTWDFLTYAAVSSTSSGRVSSITRNIYSVLQQDGGAVITVTTSGSGTTRTATASGGTPFASAKCTASATNTNATYLQTPLGIFQISAYDSDTQVTIIVPSTYTAANETTVAFKVWKKLFGSTTPTITATGTSYTLYQTSTSQAAFTITAAHKFGEISFGTSNTAAVTVSTTYNGTNRNTKFNTPLITLHDNLAGLNSGSYRHLPASVAASDFVVGEVATGNWVKKTLDETKTILGLGVGSFASAAEELTGVEAAKASSPSVSREMIINLKPYVNAAVNKLDIFTKSGGAVPDATNPIKVMIPDGNGYTQRTRAAAYLSGTSQFIMADAANYWSKGSLAGEIKTAYVYAVWDGTGIVLAIAGYSGWTNVPSTDVTTLTADDLFLYEAGSTYSPNVNHYCTVIAKFRYSYSTADTPDHTIQATVIDAPQVIWNPKSDYGYRKNLLVSTTSGGDMALFSAVSVVLKQSGKYFASMRAFGSCAGGGTAKVTAALKAGSSTYGSATLIGYKPQNIPTAASITSLINGIFYANAGDTLHGGAGMSGASGTRYIQGDDTDIGISALDFHRID